MKSVLISIKPKWVEKIASGVKTVEIRRTVPKCGLPFKAYIYCTIGNGVRGDYLVPSNIQCGKVVGEFICDKIEECIPDYNPVIQEFFYNEWEDSEATYLTAEEQSKYGKSKPLYGWHISDLRIYDKPKELSEFRTMCRDAYQGIDGEWYCKDGYGSCKVKDEERPDMEECRYFDCPSEGGESCGYCDFAFCLCKGMKPITRPPQSWCYVEEL